MNSVVQHDSLWSVIEKVARQENYSNSNMLLLFLLIDTLDIVHEGTKAREHFALFLQNGNQTMKLACLSRLKCVLKEQKNDRTFLEWAFDRLVSQISYDSKVTEMATNILYQNTKKPLNLNIVVKLLVKNPQLVTPLTRLDSARDFIYRIISTSEGFALLKNNSNFISSEFVKFTVFPIRSLHRLVEYLPLRVRFRGRFGYSNHAVVRQDSRPVRRPRELHAASDASEDPAAYTHRVQLLKGRKPSSGVAEAHSMANRSRSVA